MSRIYESMFLLDNDAVRASWPKAKAIVTDLIAKNGGTVETARRWDERPLSYPIKKRKRATYLLVHLQMPNDGFPSLNRELEISEQVLRYLHLSVAEVPAKERELSDAEGSPEFEVPEPPADDAASEPEAEDAAPEAKSETTPANAEAKPATAEAKPEAAEAKPEAAKPAAETTEKKEG